jgi:hypothetical protein
MTNTVVRCNVPMPSHGCAAARSSLSGVTSHEHAALVDEPIPTSELRRWGEEADDIAVLCCLVGRVGWFGEVTDWLALGVGEDSVRHFGIWKDVRIMFVHNWTKAESKIVGHPTNLGETIGDTGIFKE